MVQGGGVAERAEKENAGDEGGKVCMFEGQGEVCVCVFFVCVLVCVCLCVCMCVH